MVLILYCSRERVSKSLYVMQLFILAGMVYYFLHGRPEKPSEDDLGTLEAPKYIGDTLRPVWGPIDKCSLVTQNHRTENRKWRVRLKPSLRAPKVPGPEVAALEDPKDPGYLVVGKEELSSASEESKHEQKVAVVYGEEAPVNNKPSWVTWLLRGLWVDWFSAPNIPKTQNH